MEAPEHCSREDARTQRGTLHTAPGKDARTQRGKQAMQVDNQMNSISIDYGTDEYIPSNFYLGEQLA